ncbi:hypothetical protein [Thalassospira sp.]|uniref:hypothetical protein n=1 Tax=Thalassospira sp. TaxID=1912094 RepID=UPI003AA9AFAF
MTDSDAPKSNKTSADNTSKIGPNNPETGPAEAEKNLQEPADSRMAGSSEQAAMDVMSALCREFGIPDFSQTPAGTPDQRPQPMETAFQIIQRYLLGGDVSDAPQNPVPGHDSAPSVSDLTDEFSELDPWHNPPLQNDPQATNTANPDQGPHGAQIQWGVTTTHGDGSITDMHGPIIGDDMFRTAMPSLHGCKDQQADTPEWSIRMEQGHPLSPTRTSAQTAIAARLTARETPQSLRKWSVHVGSAPDAQSELSTTVPAVAPSQLRAFLFDTIHGDDSASQLSEVPIYGGEAHALHLEQTVGSPNSDDAPDLALIRLVIAGHAPVPIELEYTGPLPSPIVAGNVAINPDHSIPFWAQITPPGQGDRGAGLVLLVRYAPDAGFDVTAQLLTKARTSTPTAILTCNGQSDHAACRAASMISDSRGRLETSLTGIPDQPDVGDLEKYGFYPSVAMKSHAPDSMAAMAQPNSAQTAEPDTKAKAVSPENTPEDELSAKPSNASTTKPSSRTTKGKSNPKAPSDDNADNSKGGK